MKFSRRYFLKASAAVGAVTATSCAIAGIPLNNTKRPNILFLAVDDLNDWIGALGAHPQAKTPNIDRLIGQATTFTNAHCAVPVCGPSRNCLLTGRHPYSTGWYTNKELGMKNFEQIAENVLGSLPVLPQHFKNNGYYTMASGKISHHGTSDYRSKLQWDEESPVYAIEGEDEHLLKNGFGYGSYGRADHKYYPFPVGGGQIIQSEHFGPGTKGMSLCGGALDPEDIPHNGTMPDEFFTNWAIERLKNDYDKPFFLGLGLIRPHVPYTAPRKYFDMFPLDEIIVPDTIEHEMSDIPLYGKAMALGIIPGGDAAAVKKTNARKELVQAYLACVAFADAQIGRILDALESSKYKDNTVVMLWGDNGQNFGEHENYRKQTLWIESTRVPLIIKRPQQQEGQMCHEAVSLIDLYPTLTEMCGLPSVSANEGISLVPLLNNPNFNRKIPVITTWGYKCHAIRDKRYSYIKYRDGGEELYDRSNDPDEHNNLANNPQYAEVKQSLAKWLPTSEVLPYGMTDFNKDGGDFLTKVLANFEKNGIPDYLL